MPPEKLAAAVERLTDEVKTLHLVMEEFRVRFEWAANNHRLGGGEPREVSDEEPDLKAIVYGLREKLQPLAGVGEEMGQVPKKQAELF